MAKTKVFKFYSDSSHGWLAVKTKLLAELNLTNEISSSSYTKGQTNYLEEDSDLPKFTAAYQAKFGDFNTTAIDHGQRSWVRNMAPYLPANYLVIGVAAALMPTDDALSNIIDGVKAPLESEFQE